MLRVLTRETAETKSKLLLKLIENGVFSIFGRFLVVGFSSMLVNIVSLWLLTTAGLTQLLASILATEISIINGFFWNERWTFKASARIVNGKIAARFMRFELVANLTSCLTVGMFLFFTQDLHIYYLVAQFFAIAVTTIVNFTVNSCFTWRVLQAPSHALTELGKPILEASATLPGAIEIKMEID